MGRITKHDIVTKYQKDFISRFQDESFFTAIAPGRINIIGEHTDYNLGLAMPIAINRWICSIVSPRQDDKINIYSSNFDEQVSLNINQLDKKELGWERYVFGCIQVFMNEYHINKGFNILIGGNIPIGLGVSSSAALEVSLISSLLYGSGIPIDKHKVLELSNKVERDLLGIQSGFLDQYASIFSKKNSPLLIDFSTLKHEYVNSRVKGASWILINSMVDRSLADSKYNDRVEECQLGLKIINDSNKTNMQINQISSSHLEKIKDNQIIFKRIKHIITENNRVRSMKKAMEKGNLHLIGDILSQSHNSLSDDYQVSCSEIDSIIEISKKQDGFYGGRIMGGGFGGCCIGLIQDSQKDVFIEKLVSEFYKQFSYDLRVEYVNFCDGLTLVK